MGAHDLAAAARAKMAQVQREMSERRALRDRNMTQKREASREAFKKLRRTYVEWRHLGESLPAAIGDVIEQLQTGRFDVHLEHRRLEPSVNRLVLGLMTSALFVGSSLLWSRDAPPRVYGVSVFGVAGTLVSVALGFRLLRAIGHSGRLDTKEH